MHFGETCLTPEEISPSVPKNYAVASALSSVSQVTKQTNKQTKTPQKTSKPLK